MTPLVWKLRTAYRYPAYRKSQLLTKSPLKVSVGVYILLVSLFRYNYPAQMRRLVYLLLVFSFPRKSMIICVYVCVCAAQRRRRVLLYSSCSCCSGETTAWFSIPSVPLWNRSCCLPDAIPCFFFFLILRRWFFGISMYVSFFFFSYWDRLDSSRLKLMVT